MNESLTRHEMSRRGFIGATGGAVGLLALAACTSGGPAGQGGGNGDIVYLTASDFVGSWNPYANQALGNLRVQRMVYDYLMWIDNDGNSVPGLATSLEQISPLVWEAKLRQGVKFHDGQPFTAKDVKASVELASNPTSAVASQFPGQLTGEIIDDFTIRIHTLKPYAPLKLACLSCNNSGVIISHLDAAKGDAYLKKKMNGTGPFKMDAYKGESGGLVLTANRAYWRGVPKANKITVQYVGSTSTRLTALLTGQADIVEQLGPNDVKSIVSSSNAKVVHTESTEAMILDFRTQTAPMNDPALRRAICYAIDVPSIVKNIWSGYAVANTFYGQPNTLGYKADPNYFHYDPEKAKSLLASAGYPGGAGLRTLDFLSVAGAYPLTSEYSQLIVKNLADVGIKVKLSMLDEPSWTDALFKPKGDMILHGWLVPTPDRTAWYSALFKTKGLINFESDPKIDAAITAQAATSDPAERIQIVHSQLEPALVAAAPGFPMFTVDLITGVSNKISGLEIPHWYEFDVLSLSKRA
jgi:peptide/nickel transport system substrate-binding protein